MKRAALLALSSSVLAITGHSVLIAPRQLQVRRLNVFLPGLPDEWVGVRIAHLSDFHLGARGVARSMLVQASDAAARFRPDLTFITGDFFDQGRWATAAPMLFNWSRHGEVFAVLGNHDHRGGAEHVGQLTTELLRAGVQLLRNSSARTKIAGRNAWIVGLDDPHTRRDDLAMAMADVPSEGDVLAILSHSPSVVADLPVGATRMLFAGHTHGGQIRLTPSGRIPFLPQVRALKGLPPQPELRLARGRHWTRGAVVIISDGLGVSTVPARFRTRPEVILVTLRSADSDGIDCDSIDRYLGTDPTHRETVVESGESRAFRLG